MAVIIGSARSDEYGHITGGAAGDQKGGAEVSTQNFYVHSKGWYVVRAKSDTHANKIAERMRAACANNNIGYDQTGRLGVINNGIDTKTKTECDCSSLVRACVKEATGKDPGNFITSNEVALLQGTGLFMDTKTYYSGMTLYTGDILVTKTKGHTVIVTSGASRGSSSSASKPSTSSSPASHFKVGSVYTTQVSDLNVRTGPGTSYHKKSRSELTADGRKHADAEGQLKKGTKVTCKAVKTVGSQVWIQTPSGWICAYNGSKYYVK